MESRRQSLAGKAQNTRQNLFSLPKYINQVQAEGTAGGVLDSIQLWDQYRNRDKRKFYIFYAIDQKYGADMVRIIQRCMDSITAELQRDTDIILRHVTARVLKAWATEFNLSKDDRKEAMMISTHIRVNPDGEPKFRYANRCGESWYGRDTSHMVLSGKPEEAEMNVYYQYIGVYPDLACLNEYFIFHEMYHSLGWAHPPTGLESAAEVRY